MGLLTGLITLPLAPVRGTIWIAEQLLDEAQRELDDPKNIEAQLLEAEARYERGEISEEEYEVGLVSIAVPVRWLDGPGSGALNVSVLPGAMTRSSWKRSRNSFRRGEGSW